MLDEDLYEQEYKDEYNYYDEHDMKLYDEYYDNSEDREVLDRGKLMHFMLFQLRDKNSNPKNMFWQLFTFSINFSIKDCNRQQHQPVNKTCKVAVDILMNNKISDDFNFFFKIKENFDEISLHHLNSSFFVKNE